LDKFTGIWQSVNGTDTIKMKCVTHYLGNGNVQIKVLRCSYTYKSGCTVIRDNMNHTGLYQGADFGGTRPEGMQLDTLIIAGKDKLRRKDDEGYLVYHAGNNQLKFIRKIGVSGGGITVYDAGQPPLPGFTLPATIIFEKYMIPPASGERQGSGD
jgi:hypothetical protein